MSFASKTIVPGRSFILYLFQLTKGVNNNHDNVYLNDDCKQDMKMWKKSYSIGMKFHFVIDSTVSNEGIELFTDASASKCFGGYNAGKWFQGSCPKELSMNTSESKSLWHFSIVSYSHGSSDLGTSMV